MSTENDMVASVPQQERPAGEQRPTKIAIHSSKHRRGIIDRRKRRAALAFLIPGIIYFAAIFIAPGVRTVQMSLSHVDATNITQGGWPFVGLDNFKAVFHLPALGIMLRNTGWFLVGSIVPQVVAGLLLAVGLRKQTRARRVGRALILLPWMLPSAAVATTFMFIFNTRGGLANFIGQALHLLKDPVLWFAGPGTALLVIIIVNIWVGIPFNFLIIQSGLQALPDDVHEAAAVDGAGWWRELFHITIPLLSASLFSVVMMGIIGTLKVFDFVWIMTAGGPANGTLLPGLMAYQQAFVNFNYGVGSAVMVLMVVLMLILSIIYIRVTTTREQPSGPATDRGQV